MPISRVATGVVKAPGSLARGYCECKSFSSKMKPYPVWRKAMLQDHEGESREPGHQEIAPCLGVLGLTYGEHLLLWTLRRLVARRGSCPLIAHEFTKVFGEDGEETLSILRIFLGLLGTAA